MTSVMLTIVTLLCFGHAQIFFFDFFFFHKRLDFLLIIKLRSWLFLRHIMSMPASGLIKGAIALCPYTSHIVKNVAKNQDTSV